MGILFAIMHFVAILLVALTNGAVVELAMALHSVRTVLVYLSLDFATLILGTILAGVIGFIVGALFALIWNSFEAPEPALPAAKGQKATDPDGQKATDPVCGMEVDPKTAPSETYKGKTYYFCSPSCKAAFKENPAKFAKKK